MCDDESEIHKKLHTDHRGTICSVVCRVIADHNIRWGIVQGRISPSSHTTNTVYEIAAKVVLTSAFVGGDEVSVPGLRLSP